MGQRKQTYPKQQDLNVAEEARLAVMEKVDERTKKMTQNQKLEFYRTLIGTLTVEAEASESKVA